MKQNIMLAGVGGQGILLMAQVLIHASREQGFQYKQPEIHGMSQRGGPVYSHLRLSDSKIWSDLIPKGEADIIIGIEPMEALRYLQYLSPGGMLITSNTPVTNIPNYPNLDSIIDKIKGYESHILIDAMRLAKEAGSSRSQNMVMVGAASRYMILKQSNLKKSINELFSSKGEKIVDINFKAFEYGKEAADFYHQCIKAGINPDYTYALSLKMKLGDFDSKAIEAWKALFCQDQDIGSIALEAIKNYDGLIPVGADIPLNIKAMLKAGKSKTTIQEFFKSKVEPL